MRYRCTVENILAELGLSLSQAALPLAFYVAAIQTGPYVYTSSPRDRIPVIPLDHVHVLAAPVVASSGISLGPGVLVGQPGLCACTTASGGNSRWRSSPASTLGVPVRQKAHREPPGQPHSSCCSA